MGKWKLLTWGFSIMVIVAIAVWDIIVTVTPEPDDTISEQFVILNKAFPWLGYLWGVVTAHLMFPRKWKLLGSIEKHRYWVLLGSTVGALGLAFFLSGWTAVYVMGALGLLVGWFFWPQYKDNFG
jgi:hypothetical protein